MARAKVTRSPKKLPKAAGLDATKLRQDIDHDRLTERVSMVESHLNDYGKRIAQVEGSADYWSGLSARVKAIEDEAKKPTTTIIEQASGMSIAWCFLINDLLLGAIVGGWYIYTYGVPSWVSSWVHWTH